MSAAHLCGAIYSPSGELLYIDTSSDEANAWRVYLGWPDEEEIEAAKAKGLRFRQVTVPPIPEAAVSQ